LSRKTLIFQMKKCVSEFLTMCVCVYLCVCFFVCVCVCEREIVFVYEREREREGEGERANFFVSNNFQNEILSRNDLRRNSQSKN